MSKNNFLTDDLNKNLFLYLRKPINYKLINLIYKKWVNLGLIITSCKVPWLDDSYLREQLEKIELLWKSNIYQRYPIKLKQRNTKKSF